MEKKDFSTRGVGEGNLFYGYEETNSTAISIKEEMYSKVSSEVNDSGQVCTNDGKTPFCFVGIKMENPDDYESEASSANSELSDMSCTKIKVECEEGIDSCKSDTISVTIDTNKDCDSRSVVRGCDMGHSSTEFIRGIECQEYPILRVKLEERENTGLQIAPNSRILCEPDDLDDACENEMTINSSHDGNSSRLMLMEARDEVEKVSSRAVYPSPPTETAYEASAIYRSVSAEEEHCEERKEVMQRTRSNVSHYGSSNTKMQNNDQNLVPRDSICFDSLEMRGGQRLSTKIQTHPTRRRNYLCISCRKSFTRKTDLQNHTRTHTGEKPFQCEICVKSFSQKSNLKQHMRTHTRERPFQCETCKKTFTRSDNLKMHMRIHTDETPFQCGMCDSSFTFKSYLDQHMRTHSGERPFQCEICQKSFRQRSHLKGHMRTHTREREFQCETCKKIFVWEETLKMHMRIHTEEKSFQ